MAVQIKIPSVGESVKEVTIGNWPKKSGDFVELDEVVCEVESDKATVELTAETAGILKILVEAGETVPIGKIVGEIEPQGKKDAIPAKAAATAKANGSGSGSGASYAEHHPSPAAQKILSEKGLGVQQVEGTGKGGRITKTDAVKATASATATPIGLSAGGAVSPVSVPASADKDAKVLSMGTPSMDISSWPGSRDVKKEKMSALRRTIAKRLVDVKNTTAMLTTFNEVDMSALMELRSKYKETFKEKFQVNLGFMSFFTKAATLALQEFTAINAIIQGEEVLYHHYCDIGIAVSTPRGLVVPVVRNAENLNLAGLEKEILRLATKARDNKLSMDEMTGGTFTITNGGVFGSMLSTPILNAPQSGILGMHNIVDRPVAIKGEVKIRPIMYLALSYDHRIVDGKESVSFLKKIKEYIEDPSRLLLGV